MKRTLIVSPYYENSHTPKINKSWLRIQNKFLKDFTINYDFGIYLNNVSNKEYFKDSFIIGENNEFIDNSRLSHRFALREIIKYFRQHENKYDCFCILDSDCFPIRKGWLFDVKNMVRKKEFKFAAIMRLENGENFPHPSGMIIPTEYVQEDIFRFPENMNDEIPSRNIIDGNDIKDTGSVNNFWNQDNKLIGYPLIRTNVVNLHPVYCGIYGGILYHHGCGSRLNKHDDTIEPVASFRTKSYWEIHGGNFNKDISKALFDLISKTPTKFIKNLLNYELS